MTTIWRILATLIALCAICAPAGAQTPSSDPAQATLNLSAVLNGRRLVTGGLRWRLFAAQADADGSHPLIVESNLAQPTLTVPAGDYVVHVAFGLASAAKRVTLAAEVRSERLTLSAGALKIEGTLADAPIDPSKLSLAIYVPQNRNPLGKLVYAKAKAGDTIGLPEGAYHIVSTYLDTVGGRAGASPAPAPANPRCSRRRWPFHPIRSSTQTSRSSPASWSM